jgi:hypothetical protein
MREFFFNGPHIELTMPSFENPTLLHLGLRCSGIPKTMELGAYLEYVAPSVISVIKSTTCALFRKCTLDVIIKNPPPSPFNENNIILQIFNAGFLHDSTDIIQFPTFQVEFFLYIVLFSFFISSSANNFVSIFHLCILRLYVFCCH